MNLLLFKMKNQNGDQGKKALRDMNKSGSAPPLKKSQTLRIK